MCRYHLLGLLRSGPRHGYALAKEYRRRGGATIGLGAVYRELRILSQRGFVLRVHQDGDSRRASYRLSPRGRAAFDDWLDNPPDAVACSDSELAQRALFFCELPPERVRRLLDTWEADVLHLISWLNRDLQRAGDSCQEVAKGVRQTLIRRRIGHLSRDLEFLRDIRLVLDLPMKETGRRAANEPRRQREPPSWKEASSMDRGS